MSDTWNRIRQALEHPDYKWRTIDGIRHDTGFDEATIKGALAGNAEAVIKSSTPSTTGKELYTTHEHHRRKSSLWERLESTLVNKVRKNTVP